MCEQTTLAETCWNDKHSQCKQRYIYMYAIWAAIIWRRMRETKQSKICKFYSIVLYTWAPSWGAAETIYVVVAEYKMKRTHLQKNKAIVCTARIVMWRALLTEIQGNVIVIRRDQYTAHTFDKQNFDFLYLFCLLRIWKNPHRRDATNSIIWYTHATEGTPMRLQCSQSRRL